MQLSMEQLVEIVVKEVLAELARRGMVPGSRPEEGPAVQPAGSPSRVIVDMTGYRTPVLTENRVRAVERHVSELVVPAGTVCTWGARDVMAQRKMKLTYAGNNH
jgi:hypothetical protein